MNDASNNGAAPGGRRLEFPALRNPRYPVSRIAEAVEPYIRHIVDRFHPRKVVLFGSQAYGKPDRHSDVDLLVVRRGFESERDSDIEIRRSFREIPDRQNLSFTILSKTPEKLAELMAAGSPFYEEITGQGVELYAAGTDQ